MFLGLGPKQKCGVRTVRFDGQRYDIGLIWGHELWQWSGLRAWLVRMVWFEGERCKNGSDWRSGVSHRWVSPTEQGETMAKVGEWWGWTFQVWFQDYMRLGFPKRSRLISLIIPYLPNTLQNKRKTNSHLKSQEHTWMTSTPWRYQQRQKILCDDNWENHQIQSIHTHTLVLNTSCNYCCISSLSSKGSKKQSTHSHALMFFMGVVFRFSKCQWVLNEMLLQKILKRDLCRETCRLHIFLGSWSLAENQIMSAMGLWGSGEKNNKITLF